MARDRVRVRGRRDRPIVEAALDADGVQRHFVTVPGRTRVNVTLVGGDRRLEGNEPASVEAVAALPPHCRRAAAALPPRVTVEAF